MSLYYPNIISVWVVSDFVLMLSISYPLNAATFDDETKGHFL